MLDEIVWHKCRNCGRITNRPLGKGCYLCVRYTGSGIFRMENEGNPAPAKDYGELYYDGTNS